MPEYRQSIREYMRAAETLLKISEFTDDERRLVKDIVNKITADILDGRINGHARIDGQAGYSQA
jgi:hypothetical protein